MTKSEHDTPAAVKEFIDEDPVVKAALQRELVNVRALAREMQKSIGGKPTFDSIVSAIHRYPIKERASTPPVGRFISKLSLRDNIVAFGVKNDEQTWGAISKLPEEIEGSKGDVLRVITGVEAMTVILDNKNEKALTSAVPREKIMRVYENLAEVMVHLTEQSWTAKGVLSTLATTLSLSGVNIYYHFGYGPPPIIVFEVEEDDAVTAYQSLVKLRRKAMD